MRRTAILAVPVLVAAVHLAAADPVPLVVFCAPGYPGSTEQAQETMDDLAVTVARGAGWIESGVRAEYHETAEGGIQRLAAPEAAVAVVTLPLYLRYRAQLDLRPRLAGVQDGTVEQVWTLVAPAGRVAAPDDLSGWEITGVPGYAPAFVRGPVLGEWGTLPESTSITFTSRPLSALRRASRGEEVAVLLDGAQTAALESLPFADRLEIVARSGPLPASLVCAVGERIPGRVSEIVGTFERLPSLDGGPEILETIRLDGFRTVDGDRLTEVEAVYDRAASRTGDDSR